jgi:SAM-dependent methyltransferase
MTKTMTSPNEDLARLFDAQYADFSEDMPMWLALAQRHGSPLIELGCGTGRVLISLARAGHEIHGVDANPAMLARAASRLDRNLTDRVSLHDGDLRSFSIPKRFRLAIAPLNVLTELNDAHFAQSLTTIKQHLESGGVLAMDLPNPVHSMLDPTDENEPLDCFVDPESGNPIQVSAQQRMLPGCEAVALLWNYDELLPDGLVSRHQFEVSFHLRSPETLNRMLTSAEYADVSLYGDYEFGTFGESSKRMILIATAT